MLKKREEPKVKVHVRNKKVLKGFALNFAHFGVLAATFIGIMDSWAPLAAVSKNL